MKIRHTSDARRRRQAEYPPLAEQLDAILKALAYMQSTGMDIGPDGRAVVEQHQAIKRKFPKQNTRSDT